MGVPLVLVLHGCGTPPDHCDPVDFDGGKVHTANKGEAGEPDCKDGEIADAVEIVCGLVAKECLTEEADAGSESGSKDKPKEEKKRLLAEKKEGSDSGSKSGSDSGSGSGSADAEADEPKCQEVFAFVKKGEEIDEWPEHGEITWVKEFTQSWKSYLKAKGDKLTGKRRLAAKPDAKADAKPDAKPEAKPESKPAAAVVPKPIDSSLFDKKCKASEGSESGSKSGSDEKDKSGSGSGSKAATK